MCARFTLTAPPVRIAELFGLEPPTDFLPRFNIAPTQPVLVIRKTENPEFATLKWGLIPSWSKDATIGNKLFNARSETAAEKPSFRSAMKRRRCLIAADGFYEWKGVKGKKQPYYFHRPGNKPFAFAGIWERWDDADDKPLETCCLLTTDANGTVKPFHDRMPVILTEENQAAWIDPSITDAAKLAPLMVPLADKGLVVHPVSPKMNSWRFDTPECVEPVAVG